ncbi:hypothetical protein BJ166DRAFT_241612 [Pestalotiopsis sp. NC0098]|nr:hypothetical protein BJ166DRAFT_241612 [Pestalotiopsis sp. NC0098]
MIGATTIDTTTTTTTMPALLIQDSPPLRRVVEEDSDEEYEYSLSSDDTYTSDEDDEEEEIDQRLSGDGLRYIDSTTIRLPSGKTISHRPDAGFRKSKSRSHKTLTTTSASQSRTQKKLRGNCAMIPSSSASAAQKARHGSSTSSSSDNDRESSPDFDTTPLASALSSTTSPSSALNNRSRAISHKTIRASDMQMMASLPATTQRALVATQLRSAARSSRAEHKFRGKMGQFGNIKMTEHFIIDVPFGNRHKCRFPV